MNKCQNVRNRCERKRIRMEFIAKLLHCQANLRNAGNSRNTLRQHSNQWKIASMTNQRHMFDINLWFRFAVPNVYFIPIPFSFASTLLLDTEKKTVTEELEAQKLKFILILHFMSENHFVYLLVFIFWWCECC